MHTRIGAKNPIYLEEWVIARNYSEFITLVTFKGLPDIVSFDHDLAFEHYDGGEQERGYEEETGADCAKWLVNYCNENSLDLPECWIHSMNPVGAENIKNILNA